MMSVKEKTRDLINSNKFVYPIRFLIIISLITFSLDTLPNLSNRAKEILYLIEVITVMIFTLEYIIRVWVAEKRMRFIKSPFAVIDLISILPFYLSFGVDLRALRVVRLLKLFKNNKGIDRFYRAFLIAKEELIIFGSVAAIMLFLSAVGIYYCENTAQPEQFSSVFHSLWWAVTTLTTVGYGDMYPITVGGKIFTFFILTIGLGIIAIPIGLVSSALSKARDEETNTNKQCKHE